MRDLQVQHSKSTLTFGILCQEKELEHFYLQKNLNLKAKLEKRARKSFIIIILFNEKLPKNQENFDLEILR